MRQGFIGIEKQIVSRERYFWGYLPSESLNANFGRKGKKGAGRNKKLKGGGVYTRTN